MEDTDKQSLDDIDGGIVHHVGEEGDHPQHKPRVNFAEEVKRERGRERERENVKKCSEACFTPTYTL